MKGPTCLAVMLTVLFCTLSPPALAAETPPAAAQQLPRSIRDGLGAYKTSGPDAAMRVWFRGSVLERSSVVKSQAKELKGIKKVYGTFRGYHLVHAQKLTPSTRIIYLAIDLEEGPLFARFLVFKRRTKWLVVKMDFALVPEEVYPERILVRPQPGPAPVAEAKPERAK